MSSWHQNCVGEIFVTITKYSRKITTKSKFIVTQRFADFSPCLVSFIAFRLVPRRKMTAERHGGEKLVNTWQSGSSEGEGAREKTGVKIKYILPRQPAVIYCL